MSGFTSIADVLSTLGLFVAAVFTWAQDLIDFMISNPILMVPMLLFWAAGGVIGIVGRMFRGF